MEKEKKNIFGAAGILLFSVIILCAIPKQIGVSVILGATSSVNSRWFPYLTAGLLGVISLVELIVSLRKYCILKRQSAEASAEGHGPSKGMIRALLVFALFILYAVLFKTLGFVLATAIVPPIALFVNGGRKWQYYVGFYLVAAITYFLFVYALKIALP